MNQIRNAMAFVAACTGFRERVAMALWLAWFALRRSIWPALDGVRTMSFRGVRFCLDWRASEHVPIREVLIRHEYWPEEVFQPAPGQSVVDVGANAGVYAVHAANRVGTSGRVIAIEPNPDVFARLDRNVQANGVVQICSLVRAAVSNRAGVGSLVVGANSTIGYLADRAEFGVQVPVCRLDDLVEGFNLGNIDLVKVDVEGSELAVLQGGSECLRRTRRIVIEVSEATATDVESELATAGFERIFRHDVGRSPAGLLVFGERRRFTSSGSSPDH